MNLKKLREQQHSFELSKYEISKLLNLIDEMRGALEFYGHPNHWVIPAGSGDAAAYITAMCDIQKDCGAKAHEALAKLKAMEEE